MRLSCLKQHYLFISYAVCFWFVCLLPVAVAATVLASPFAALLRPLRLLLLLLLVVRCLVALSLPRQKLIFINSAHTQRGTHRSRKQASKHIAAPITHPPQSLPWPLSLLSIAAACHGPTTIDRFNGYRQYRRCGRCEDCVDLFALVLIWLWLKIPLSEANKCGFPLLSPLPCLLLLCCNSS